MSECRNVIGWPRYQVSDDGRVRSASGREIGWDDHGYRRVVLSRAGVKRKVYVHQLVCEAFHGPAPEGCEVAHGDGNGLNNAASNLRWATRLENIHDKPAHGTQPMGESVYIAKLTDDRVREILSSPLSARKLAGVFGVGPATVTAVRLGRTWKHIERRVR